VVRAKKALLVRTVAHDKVQRALALEVVSGVVVRGEGAHIRLQDGAPGVGESNLFKVDILRRDGLVA
jgi:hypothetical protein